MTKEEKIKEEWGEDYEEYNPDENGWSSKSLWHEDIDFNKYNTDCVAHGVYKIRPKSLKGIEHNNGWNKISEIGLPEPEETIIWLRDEGEPPVVASMLDSDFYGIDYFTHWRPYFFLVPLH